MYSPLVERIISNVNKVIVGKDKVIEDIIKGILAGGHILIEDIPGVGKTTMVKALSKTLGLNFNRIQFTPDLLPSDIIGVSVYNPKDMKFEYRKGPVFTNILLADEINRTSPKTQSALLEVMEETQISEGNTTYRLECPFIVLATSNPIEFDGTFELPEAQLDRFSMKIVIGYPKKMDEISILRNFREENPLDTLERVVERDELLKAMAEVKHVQVSEAVMDYIGRLSYETRNSRDIMLGASPRASLALMKIAQAQAYIEARDYVIPDDVKNNAVAVLSHRMRLTNQAKNRLVTGADVIREIIKTTEVPR